MTDKVMLNYGPQHPSAHGVLRLVLELDGEIVRRADPNIGFLHRGTEKLAEERHYLQNLHYFDRMDYISPLGNEHSYVLAVERLLGLEVPRRAQFIRVIMAEITRIMNHIFMISTMANDLGAITPVLWGFEQREVGMTLMEKVSGARMHTGYFRFGGVARDLPEGFTDEVLAWLDGGLKEAITDLDKLLTDNPIFKERTMGVGAIDADTAVEHGFSGPNLRASGVAWDLRKAAPYDAYDAVDFDIPVAQNGDCYSRYLVRMAEIWQSMDIIKQAIKFLPQGEYVSPNHKVAPAERATAACSMEEMIHNFRLFSQGFDMPAGEIYAATEAPKGEFGVYLVSTGGPKPHRLHVRAPSFAHLQAVQVLARDANLADIAAILGSLDLVFGEIDR